MKKIIFKKFNKDIFLFFITYISSFALIVWIVQAVNYLDLIYADGHGLRIYFLYTFFLLPKVIGKLLPLIFIISLFYMYLKYEEQNQLLIYWSIGISKQSFMKNIFNISLIFFCGQLILTIFIIPFSSDKGRSFFKESRQDLFLSIIKEKTFIDSVKNLTIFVDNKDDNQLNNVIIKETISKNSSQIIIAQHGIIESAGVNNTLKLFNGKIIDTNNVDQKIISFSTFRINLDRFNSNTITNQKTQEMDSLKLFKCVLKIVNFKKNNLQPSPENIIFFNGCSSEIEKSIAEEFAERFFKPFYILLIGAVSALTLFVNKLSKSYTRSNLFYFFLCVAIIILSEVTLSFLNLELKRIFGYILLPIICTLLLYTSFFKIKNQYK